MTTYYNGHFFTKFIGYVRMLHTIKSMENGKLYSLLSIYHKGHNLYTHVIQGYLALSLYVHVCEVHEAQRGQN